jgi:hypothetical protein
VLVEQLALTLDLRCFERALRPPELEHDELAQRIARLGKRFSIDQARRIVGGIRANTREKIIHVGGRRGALFDLRDEVEALRGERSHLAACRGRARLLEDLLPPLRHVRARRRAAERGGEYRVEVELGQPSRTRGSPCFSKS